MELKHLKYLDLSGNYFQHSKIPKFFGFLNKLRYLNLSCTHFTGKVPHQLGNLTNLQVLDLRSGEQGAYADDFQWSSSLLSLQHLDMSGVDLGSAHNLMEVLTRLPSLLNVQLSWCRINLSGNQFLVEALVTGQNLSTCGMHSLESLSLGSNDFGGKFPNWLGQLRGLKHLDLSYSSLHGPIPPSLWNLSNLRVVDLSENQLNGTIPHSLGRLSMLRELNVGHNQLSGVIPRSLGQLVNLEVFDISTNSLEGTLSEIHFSNLSRLKSLDIGNNYNLTFKRINIENCKIDGSEFLQWLRTQEEVEYLSLKNTSISGSFPMWLLSMPLSDLDLSTNQLSGPLPSSIGDDMPALEILFISDNLINGSIPNSLCRLNNLQELDLSRNMLHGQIPHCWVDSLRIVYINLSSNQLSGTIPGSLCNLPLLWLHVNNNSLSGTLPLALRNCTQLRCMDLGENRLSGVIPTWIGENYLYLEILRLRENTFTGSIPLSLCRLSYLKILDTACNHLIGRIPLCFNNLSGMTTTNPVASWYTNDKAVEVMKGQYLEYTRILMFVVNMDLSSNNLVGRIPQQLTTLDGLLGLNLSHNHLSGSIPHQIGNMKSLLSLDFSDNQISGTIPESMSILTSLSYLNLSYNNLSGKIPKGNQLQTLTDPTIYAGNQLCGDPLPKCASDGEQVQPPISIGAEDEEQGEGKSEKFWFYFVVSCGYATGLSGVFWILMVKKNWRIAYFRYADKAKDWVLVMVAVQVARLKRKMEGNNNGTE
ncbi:hypothetical protein UlMin_010989 [Ulmus minor]